MTSLLRTVLIAMGGIILLMIVWISTPSSLFYEPILLSLDGRQTTLLRKTPYGEVTVHWIGEVTLLDRDGFECFGEGTRIAQVIKDDILREGIGAWAWPCLDQGSPLILRYEYQVLVFGLIPLRPAGVAVTFNSPSPEADKS